MIEVSKIRIDGGTQARAAINEQTVAEYAEAMEDPATVFPPVVVYHDGRDYWLADGFHRLAAWQRIGRTEVPAEVRMGDRRAAILHACGANHAHGLRPSRDDKRRAVMCLLADDEWAHWADRAIARHCHVSPSTVAKYRQEATGVTVQMDSETRTYTTKHGTEAQMDTSRIGKPDTIPSETEGATTVEPERPGDGSRGSRQPQADADVTRADEQAPEAGEKAPAAAGESPAPEPEDPATAKLRREFRALTREAQEEEFIGLRLQVEEQKKRIRKQTGEIADLKARVKELSESSDLGPVVSNLHAQVARLKDARDERQTALAKETRRANFFEAEVKKLRAQLENRVEAL